MQILHELLHQSAVKTPTFHEPLNESVGLRDNKPPHHEQLVEATSAQTSCEGDSTGLSR